MVKIESFLAARSFLSPQIVENRIYFISNLSGRLSLYVMNVGGSVPEPLLPPGIAMHNPHLIDGKAYAVFPAIGTILIMLDKDGDENYQPMQIPITGGYPEPTFNNFFKDNRVHLVDFDPKEMICYLVSESRTQSVNEAYQVNLNSGELIKLAESRWGSWIDSYNKKHTRVTIIDGYTVGDNVLYMWEKKSKSITTLYGTPIEVRASGQVVPLNSITATHFTRQNRGLLMITSLFDDAMGLAYLKLSNPSRVKPVKITGVDHRGSGMLVNCVHLSKDDYLLEYNIDGASWLYEGIFDESKLKFSIESTLVGKGKLSGGVLDSYNYDKATDRFIVSFSTATSPTQLFIIQGKKRKKVIPQTSERVLGVLGSQLAAGEDASFTSYDGLRVSARLYLPADDTLHQSPYPLVYYIHGGPQSQERPDFSWFSMPLIQYLTLNGFAVFVPNVRGSSGHGMNYMKHVSKDWGGEDRLDHVHALQFLKNDRRIDTSRAGVVGRSYGGYMTLTLASRHPELWSAAIDMFGPYDLLTFSDRIPETWKPFFNLELGDPVKDREFLLERSPRTYIDQIQCPLLVIQGKNDPRVVELESRDLVEHLRSIGKEVDYLVFEDEGHDILKIENKATCYNKITEFFKIHLKK